MKKSTAIAIIVVAVVALLFWFGYSLGCFVSEIIEELRPISKELLKQMH